MVYWLCLHKGPNCLLYGDKEHFTHLQKKKIKYVTYLQTKKLSHVQSNFLSHYD